MLMAKWVAVVLYCLIGLGLMVQGVRYLVVTEFRPYHEAVVGTPWPQVTAAYQRLILGLLKGFGAGALCAGLTLFLVAIVPLRLDHEWARSVAAVLTLTYTAGLIYATRFALVPGSRPIAISITLFVLGLVAAIASYFQG